MVEKNFSAWKEEGKKKKQLFTVSVSRFIWLEKKETTSLEADVDTVSVVEDGRGSLEPLWLQGRYWWPLEFLWLSILTADRTLEKPRLWYQDWNQPANCNLLDPKDSVVLFFPPPE